MNEIKTAIEMVNFVSQMIEKVATDPKHFNSYYSLYLEQIGWDLFKTGKKLEQINNSFGGV